ncbi:ribosomal protein S2, flavodoxin-like domain-containing protein [Mycena rosella]|uniref:Ribosomal protein S2, flavodoxin-like domain-containing protein n=1 Tax=Mycena rosella TaxID=1033263 RepID=A0AAD7DLJ4_MYCRO|nr:ribosomal protein S2, flavodoxin-like domain-containing protein [Mycena rosella]
MLGRRCRTGLARVSPWTYTRALSDRPPLGDRPLRSFEDWAELQLRRAEVGTLIDIFSQYGSNRTQENTYKLRDATRRPVPNAAVSSLLAAGAHFGHATSRMNPNFMPYAYGVRANATIIDLDHTVPLLRRAANLVRAVAYAGGQILFIGTRADLRQIVKTAAGRIGKQGYYISDRWIPGTLTNTAELYTPQVAKEIITIPDLVILLNPLSNITAIRECALAHVPTIAIIDSDADPRIVMYPIPANDESPQTAEIVAGILSIAGREGLALRMEEEVMEEEDRQESDDEDFWDMVAEEKRSGTDDGLQQEPEDDDAWLDEDSDEDLNEGSEENMQAELEPTEADSRSDEESGDDKRTRKEPQGQRFDY